MSPRIITAEEATRLLAAFPAEPALAFEAVGDGAHVGVRGSFFYEGPRDNDQGLPVCITEGEARMYDAAPALAEQLIAQAAEIERRGAIVCEYVDALDAMHEAGKAQHEAMQRADGSDAAKNAWFAAALEHKKSSARWNAASDALRAFAKSVKR